MVGGGALLIERAVLLRMTRSSVRSADCQEVFGSTGTWANSREVAD